MRNLKGLKEAISGSERTLLTVNREFVLCSGGELGNTVADGNVENRKCTYNF